jgi:RimJ/RimL family protein N-acetyltransferase
MPRQPGADGSETDGGARSSDTHNVFAGQRVRLRGIEPEDWETFYAWNADSEAARRDWRIPFPVSKEYQRRWAEKQAVQDGADDSFRFVIETFAGEMVGSIVSSRCDRRNGTFTYGLAIGSEHRRKGYASEAIWLLLGYFFGELRYQKVTAHVYSFNEPSLALHEKLGFVREGCLRRMQYTAGQYFDEVIFGMTAEEFAARHGPR